ncbi:1,4-dihydroxy-2-naphthoate octaprenyltransferase [Halobacteroides halobius DSM 5150]|uniref:1,4-dihydroxy-2-naphthoate octaprenyltransferase n=1 Tax=Halobacteroides halobius (strain ATCC 35273 / DSM 5150 / MD-1) TaxID=748449 RepID=L0K9G1_HALHC|nr:1,4-dihydroxy-2-naphthoate octaprenyltransferase [Halobacteroides halobius]AGB41922.1 1,4-dihydroxy-2-naphthoate octaprenyltransferase [Halobacteroides halobius DSM 5150]
MFPLKIWIKAFRPLFFTASLLPVFLGTGLAIKQGQFDIGLFILTICGIVLLHGGSNLLNDYYDYKSKVDTKDSYGSSGILVAGLIPASQIKTVGLICFGLALPIIFYLSYLRGALVVILSIIGILGGCFYTAKPINYKYYALGVPMVFLLFGPLIVIGSYYVQTASYNHQVLLISIPLGLLVSAILQGNDFRDIEHDSNVEIKTLAILLGRELAAKLYLGLVSLAYLILVWLVLKGVITKWALISLITLPYAFNNMSLVRRATVNSKLNVQQIDLQTAQLHFKFGALLTLAIISANFLG